MFCQNGSKSIKIGSERVPRGLREVPAGFLSRFPKRFPGFPKGSERFRKIPKGSERFRKIPKAPLDSRKALASHAVHSILLPLTRDPDVVFKPLGTITILLNYVCTLATLISHISYLRGEWVA